MKLPHLDTKLCTSLNLLKKTDKTKFYILQKKYAKWVESSVPTFSTIRSLMLGAGEATINLRGVASGENSHGERTPLLVNGCLSLLDAAERHSESDNPGVFDNRGTSDSTEEFQSHLQFIPVTLDYRQEVCVCVCAYVPDHHTHLRGN